MAGHHINRRTSTPVSLPSRDDDGIVVELAYTYIVRCADDTLYVGHTENLDVREQTHNDGKGAKYTASRRPVRMVYAEQFVTVESAIARERQLKRWGRGKKEALIVNDRTALASLGRRRTMSQQFTWRDLLGTRRGE